MKNRVVSLLLIVVMMVGMMPAIGITAEAATADPMNGGMTFTAQNEYIVPYKLDVGAGMTRKEAITIEAEVYIPDTKRAGVVVGTYSGTGQHDLSLEIESNGRVRIYTSKIRRNMIRIGNANIGCCVRRNIGDYIIIDSSIIRIQTHIYRNIRI